MPTKHKFCLAKVKSANVNVDHIELIDKALGECSGLQDWITGVLAEVNNIKQKGDMCKSVKTSEKSKTTKNTEKNKQKIKQTHKHQSEDASTLSLNITGKAKNSGKGNARTMTPTKSGNAPKSAKEKSPTSQSVVAKSKSNTTPNIKFNNHKHHKSPKKAKSARTTKSSLGKNKDNADSASDSGCSSSSSNEISGSAESDLHKLSEALPLLDGEALSLIGRSSQECLASYSKVNKRYLEVKRSMDSLMVDLNRVSSIVNRQRNIFHGGLLSTNNTLQVCHH